MDNPKIRLLIDMGTNKLKQSMNAARRIVDSGVNAARQRLNSLSAPSLNTGRFSQFMTGIRTSVNNAVDGIRTRLGNIEAPAIRTEAFSNSLARLRLMAMVASAAIGAAIGFSINEGLKGSANKISFQVLAGDMEGTKLFDDLTKFANDSIFGSEVYDMGKQMLAFGANVKSVMPDLKMLGDISMGDKEKLGSLTLAFSQIRAQGRLMGGDLLQLVNAGFNPLQAIHEKTGESMVSLKKKMEDGKITFDMVAKTFKDATSEGGKFFNMTGRIAATEFGQWEALKGQIQGIALAFGTSLLPAVGQALSAMAPALDMVPGMLNALMPAISDTIKLLVPILALATQIATVLVANLAPVLNTVASVLSSVLNPTLKFVGDNLDVLAIGLGAAGIAWLAFNASAVMASISTGLWTAAQWLLNIALSANPIGIIIVAIGALVAAIAWVVKHTEGWGGAWIALKTTVSVVWKQMKMHWDFLKDSFLFGFDLLKLEFKSFGQYIMGVVGNIKKAWDLAWEGNFSGAKDALVADIHTEASKQIDELKAQQAKKTEEYIKQTAANAKEIAEAWSNVNIRWKDSKETAAGGLNPDKVTTGNKGGKANEETKTKENASKVTGAASQTRNVTITFDSYIKGDVITQNKSVQSMSKDELDRWLREHFLRLIQGIETAY